MNEAVHFAGNGMDSTLFREGSTGKIYLCIGLVKVSSLATWSSCTVEFLWVGASCGE